MSAATLELPTPNAFERATEHESREHWLGEAGAPVCPRHLLPMKPSQPLEVAPQLPPIAWLQRSLAEAHRDGGEGWIGAVVMVAVADTELVARVLEEIRQRQAAGEPVGDLAPMVAAEARP